MPWPEGNALAIRTHSGYLQRKRRGEGETQGPPTIRGSFGRRLGRRFGRRLDLALRLPGAELLQVRIAGSIATHARVFHSQVFPEHHHVPAVPDVGDLARQRSEEHTSELQSPCN